MYCITYILYAYIYIPVRDTVEKRPFSTLHQ